jgi:alpha-mannosidase
VLLHQFHDMLPGSSIHWVHEDSAADYALVRGICEDVISRAGAAIADRVGAGGAAGGAGAVLVLNAGSHARTDLVQLVLSSLELSGLGVGDGLVAVTSPNNEAGEPVQVFSDGRVGFVAQVPGCGWARYDLVPADGNAKVVAGGTLEPVTADARSPGPPRSGSSSR